MTAMNKFREVFEYLCPFCNAPYRTIVENGNSKFVHKDVTSTKDKVKLPTSKCVPYHDYVVFKPCGHCCPDVFEECRACKLGHPGKLDLVSRPTQEECFYHYYRKEIPSEGGSRDQTSAEIGKDIDKPAKQSRNQPVTHIPKVFISYSHKDEVFKDELITMLAGLQRRDVIDAWQDRQIEPGTLWSYEITRAIDECRIALLLMSPDFIASGFIQEKELTQLFQRRLNEGLRIIPIILRPCLWQSEPIIKDLQGLPKDGRAIITFSKETGDRDQVWVEIGKTIERIAIEIIESS